MARTLFKHPPWAAPVAVVVGASSLVVAYLFRSEEPAWTQLFYIAFGLFWFVAAIESRAAYLRLGDQALEYRENFRSVSFARAEIEKVTWEAGCGVSILLTTGEWKKIPTFFENSQGVTNSIRAWLNKQ